MMNQYPVPHFTQSRFSRSFNELTQFSAVHPGGNIVALQNRAFCQHSIGIHGNQVIGEIIPYGQIYQADHTTTGYYPNSYPNPNPYPNPPPQPYPSYPPPVPNVACPMLGYPGVPAPSAPYYGVHDQVGTFLHLEEFTHHTKMQGKNY